MDHRKDSRDRDTAGQQPESITEDSELRTAVEKFGREIPAPRAHQKKTLVSALAEKGKKAAAAMKNIAAAGYNAVKKYIISLIGRIRGNDARITGSVGRDIQMGSERNIAAAISERVQKKTARRRVSPRSVLRTVRSALDKSAFAIVTVLLILCTTGSICAIVFAMYVDNYIDNEVDTGFFVMRLNNTTTILSRDNETGEKKEYYQLKGTHNRVWAHYEEIPPNMVKAIIAIEDERFIQHKGVDWKRTFGAFLQMATTLSSSYGGSTITQQTIKLLTGENDPTIKRKVQEIMRALRLEQDLSKEQILEIYLNTINLSQGCYGIKSAARVYFGKELSELTLAECASLAGITNWPVYYDPFVYPENNKDRQMLVLGKMLELGAISREEYDAAAAEELVFVREAEEQEAETVNSYYTDQLISDVARDLQKVYGYSSQVALQMIYSGGLTIEACVDPTVQKTMEDVFTDPENFVKLAGAVQPEAAMVVMKADGTVLGIVGGRGRKTGNRLWNRATQSKRQPGSAIKPITVYAPAIEYGLIKRSTVVNDSPSLWMSANGSIVPSTYTGTKKLWPANYYHYYKGDMSVREAVAISANTVPVRILEQLTLEKSFDFATQNLGITTLVKGRTTKSSGYQTDMGYPQLALGGLTDGVTVLEMTAAYCTFTNNGIHSEPRTYSRVLNSEGKVLLNNVPVTNIAVKPSTCDEINYLLSQVVSSGTGTAAKIKGIVTAGKTGTTTSDFDRWFVGYTPYYVGSVWFGYDKNKTVAGISGNPSLKLWKRVMDKLHDGKPNVSAFASASGSTGNTGTPSYTTSKVTTATTASAVTTKPAASATATAPPGTADTATTAPTETETAPTETETAPTETGSSGDTTGETTGETTTETEPALPVGTAPPG